MGDQNLVNLIQLVYSPAVRQWKRNFSDVAGEETTFPYILRPHLDLATELAPPTIVETSAN